jgi:hypothetical protein
VVVQSLLQPSDSLAPRAGPKHGVGGQGAQRGAARVRLCRPGERAMDRRPSHAVDDEPLIPLEALECRARGRTEMTVDGDLLTVVPELLLQCPHRRAALALAQRRRRRLRRGRRSTRGGLRRFGLRCSRVRDGAAGGWVRDGHA